MVSVISVISFALADCLSLATNLISMIISIKLAEATKIANSAFAMESDNDCCEYSG